jgi:hypothetical protein
MMNHWGPGSLGKSDELFDFLKPKPKGQSVYDIFLPSEPSSSAPGPSAPGPSRKSGGFYDFFKPAHKRTEEPSLPSGGDPFAAAAIVRPAPKGRSLKERPSAEAWRPYPRMREGYQAPVSMSGSGDRDGTDFLKNPAFWLIAGVTVLIALEANGVTKLSSNA